MRNVVINCAPAGPVIGEAIRQMREARGFTQADLARRAGVTQQRIAALESPRANPTVATLDKVAAACGELLVVVWDSRGRR